MSPHYPHGSYPRVRVHSGDREDGTLIAVRRAGQRGHPQRRELDYCTETDIQKLREVSMYDVYIYIYYICIYPAHICFERVLSMVQFQRIKLYG